MKLFVQTKYLNHTVPDFILDNPNIDGIAIDVGINSFLSQSNTFEPSYAKKITDAMKQNWAAEKVSSASINFGKFMPHIPGIPYLFFKEARKNNPKQVLGITEPIPWTVDYVNFVRSFFEWFKLQLIKNHAYQYLEYIKISMRGYFNYEMRSCDYDATGTGDPYENAAKKWLTAGWKNDLTRSTMKMYIDMMYETFTDKIICLQVIGGKSGEPRIDDNNKFCTVAEQPNIGQEMVNYGVKYPLFAPGTTAISKPTPENPDGNTPQYVYNSVATYIIGQIAESLYAPVDGKQPVDPQGALDNAKENNCTHVETFVNSVRAFPNQHS